VPQTELTVTTLDLTFHENFLINFLRTRSAQEWNDWMKKMFDQNIICSVWSEHEQPPPLTLHFDFRGADLRNLNSDGLNFCERDLTGANFSPASLQEAIFRWAPMDATGAESLGVSSDGVPTAPTRDPAIPAGLVGGH
jgi:uncharacterized protein YjbI with pentapeptide repeats